ncbi:MAG: hypothetical protein ACF8XB_18390 [Planctomycetota bacterium JB042]
MKRFGPRVALPACLVLSGLSEAAATTWYVNVNTGSDVAGMGLSPSTPFKTITWALSQSSTAPGIASGDTVVIYGGSYVHIDGGGGEDFPLHAPAGLTDITLTGRGLPVVSAYYFKQFVGIVNYDQSPSAHPACLTPGHCWVVQGLKFENAAYDKTTNPSVDATSFNIAGIYVEDLQHPTGGTGTLVIEDCEFDDTSSASTSST